MAPQSLGDSGTLDPIQRDRNVIVQLPATVQRVRSSDPSPSGESANRVLLGPGSWGDLCWQRRIAVERIRSRAGHSGPETGVGRTRRTTVQRNVGVQAAVPPRCQGAALHHRRLAASAPRRSGFGSFGATSLQPPARGQVVGGGEENPERPKPSQHRHANSSRLRDTLVGKGDLSTVTLSKTSATAQHPCNKHAGRDHRIWFRNRCLDALEPGIGHPVVSNIARMVDAIGKKA